MKFNIKILKGILSVALAATMTASCFVGSVGAFKSLEGASQEVVEGINSLNLKVNDYMRRLRSAREKLSDIRESAKVKSNGNVGRLTFTMINKLHKLDGIGSYSTTGLYHLSYDVVYDLDDVRKIGEMLNALEKDVDVLVDQVDRIEVDYDQDEVFLRNGVVNANINLDENQNNEDRIKLTQYRMDKEFGKKCKDLDNNILHIHEFAQSSVDRTLRKAIQSMDNENSELLRKWDKKIKEYEEARSNFWDMKEILHIRGRHSGGLTRAINGLTNNSWDFSSIRPERKIQMLSSEGSAREAIEQVDVAIQEMNKYIAINVAKLNAKGKDEIFACLNRCIDELSNRQNIIVSENGEEKFVKEAFGSSEAFKNINKEFTAAYLKLKPWMMAKGDEGNQLITEFKDLYLELLDLYTFNNDLSQNEFEAKVQEKVQNVRNKLNVIAEKCEH